MTGRPAGLLCAGLLAAGLLISGCQEVEETTSSVYKPATVQEIQGLEVKQVTFTPEGAEQVELKTATAEQRGRQVVVPYAALIYDGQGVPWVYKVTKPLTFLRQKVVVDRIEGDVVWLNAGLAAGTQVVTIGAAEVYGSELDIEGGH